MASTFARVVDAMVAAVAPQWALSRAEARARLELARSSVALGYRAARNDRGPATARVGSADHELLADLRVLRDKSRQLVRDDAHAAAAVQVKLDNVVGTGINVQADVQEGPGVSQQAAEQWNRDVEACWREWCEGACDATGQFDFADLTRQVYRTRLLDGETFAHRLSMRRPGQLAVAWELVDADRIDETVYLPDKEVRGGVEVDDYGRPLRYWVNPRHWDDLQRNPTAGSNLPVPIAREIGGVPNMLHVFRRLRPGQTRGEPMIVPALPLFDHLNHYLDSEIIAARINANFAMFVERPVNPMSDPDIVAEVGGYDGGTGGSANLRYYESNTPGQIEYLNSGEKISSFGHNRPGTTFDPFVTRVLRAIGAALDLPYELIVKEFGGMNYSSARVALLEARRGFNVERSQLVAQWVQPCWRLVIGEGIRTGRLQPPTLQDYSPLMRARFIGAPYGMVDQAKEVAAARESIAAGFSTPDEEAGRNGMDAQDVLRAKARHLVAAREIERQHKLPPGILTNQVAALAAAEQDQPEQPEDQ
jgi:lambda family phage portal protein